MRFVPTLLQSLAQCLPTTAHPKGGHGRLTDASRSHSVSSVPQDSHGHINRQAARHSHVVHSGYRFALRLPKGNKRNWAAILRSLTTTSAAQPKEVRCAS